jgi:ADP-heptose:LPS heptosyltransferase
MTASVTVLALRPLGVGDLLTGIPALRALRRHFQGSRVLLAAPPRLRALARHVDAVDDVLPAEPLRPVAGVEHPDVAVDLHGRGPASQRVLLALRPGMLIAFRNSEVAETAGMPQWHQDEHEVARWCRLLSESGIPADPSDLGIAPPCTELGRAYHGCAVIHPGAAYAARKWPAERFVTVARHCVRRGLRVVVTGGPEEAALGDGVSASTPGAVSLAARTTMLELLDVVGHAAIVVSGDTGVAHMATATGRPSVVLFGPTPPAWWGPPGERTQHRVLWAGRRGDPHGQRPDRGLLEIDIPSVIAAVDSVLETAGRNGSAIGASSAA